MTLCKVILSLMRVSLFSGFSLPQTLYPTLHSCFQHTFRASIKSTNWFVAICSSLVKRTNQQLCAVLCSKNCKMRSLKCQITSISGVKSLRVKMTQWKEMILVRECAAFSQTYLLTTIWLHMRLDNKTSMMIRWCTLQKNQKKQKDHHRIWVKRTQC